MEGVKPVELLFAENIDVLKRMVRWPTKYVQYINAELVQWLGSSDSA